MFQFDLCLLLGIKHPDYLLKSLTATQMRDWEIVYNLKPFGAELGFYQAGIICYVLAEINRDAKVKPEPYKPEDFIPERYLGKGEVKKQTMEYMKTILTAMSTKREKKK